MSLASGSVNWFNRHGKQNGGSSKNLKTELLYDLAVPLLSIYSKKTKMVTQKDVCTFTFMVLGSIFTTAKMWKQPKCPLRVNR